ncbi:MAG TPA: FAD-binding protein [Candidatus Dormibacteraeota bacterium]|nr:FAD-binding protein [Candidatus Dormibacteraeota bacterium]
MPEVVVVGGGLAGCWAAVTAARSGLKVVLVRRGPAATAMSSGALDMVPPSGAWEASAWLARLPRDAADHPYLAGGAAPPPLAELEAEAGRLAAALGAAGLRLRVGLERPALLAAVTGQLRHAGVAVESVAGGDLRELRRVAVAGIRGLLRTDADAVAAAIAQRLRIECRGVTLDLALPELEDIAGDLDDASVARAVEAPGGAEVLGEALAATLGGGGVDLVLLPAVLGLEDSDRVRARVEAAGGIRVAELLSPPPSAPGWRLARAAETMARRAGVEVLTGSVTAVSCEGDRAVAVEVAGGERLACEVLVLATGSFLGGGLVADRRLREPLLGLPLFVDGRDAGSLSPRDLVERTRFAPQPFLAAGVRTDASGRPVDGFDAPVLDNLVACGALLAGLDTTLRSGGLGVAVWTAARAGRTAARLRGVEAA